MQDAKPEEEPADKKHGIEGLKNPTLGTVFKTGGLGTMSSVTYEKAAADLTLDDKNLTRNERLRKEAHESAAKLKAKGYSPNAAYLLTSPGKDAKQSANRSRFKSTSTNGQTTIQYIIGMLPATNKPGDQETTRQWVCCWCFKMCQDYEKEKNKPSTLTAMSSKAAQQQITASAVVDIPPVSVASRVSAFSSNNSNSKKTQQPVAAKKAPPPPPAIKPPNLVKVPPPPPPPPKQSTTSSAAKFVSEKQPKSKQNLTFTAKYQAATGAVQKTAPQKASTKPDVASKYLAAVKGNVEDKGKNPSGKKPHSGM